MKEVVLFLPVRRKVKAVTLNPLKRVVNEQSMTHPIPVDLNKNSQYYFEFFDEIYTE